MRSLDLWAIVFWSLVVGGLILFTLTSGCSYLEDSHNRRVAEIRLVQAEANALNRCSSPKLEGLTPCVYPATWPYTSTAKQGEVPQFSLLPPFGLSTILTGGLAGSGQ